MGLVVNPEARMYDGFMHVSAFTSPMDMIYELGKARLGLKSGCRSMAKKVVLKCEEPQYLQIDGDLEKKDTDFEFEIEREFVNLVY